MCVSYFRFEQSVLTSQLGLQNGGMFWIGLNDLESTGDYSWSDGTPVTYTHWDQGMPGWFVVFFKTEYNKKMKSNISTFIDLYNRNCKQQTEGITTF